MATQYSIKIASEVNNLTQVEALIEQLLAEEKISDTVYGNVIVALTEATLNAIKHGNKEDASKFVDVLVELDDKEINFIVEDEGSGFDYENLPDPTDPENLEKVNGRGIFIIENLADKLSFENNGSKLLISFSLNVPEELEA